ncbi:MAG: ATPase [Treponema sp.]|jgi:V/A-type H+-transporting ATPase subunit I|nr:ATPase [Treponema sp.]
MKKVSLIVLDSERREAAAKLRGLGVVHLEALQGSGAELSAAREKSEKTSRAGMLLSEYKAEKNQASGASLSGADLLAKAENLITLAERKKTCFDQITANQVELERFSKWGAVNPDDFDWLAEKGVFLSLYEIPVDKYYDLPESIQTIHIGSDKSQCRFLLLSQADRNRPADMPPEAYAVPLPRTGTLTLEAETAALKAEIAKIEAKLRESASLRPQIAAYNKSLQKDVEFETVCSGMNRADDALCWFTGYVPSEDAAKVDEAAQSEHWGAVFSDPEEEDPVPTKLKNNRLASLIYPLTDFLETVPGYHEYDISGWFLLFFCIFFGMIFGDAGYGALLAVIAASGIGISGRKGQKAPAALKMLLLLSISNIAWGVITCTWFGVSPDVLPAFLKGISIPAISNATAALSAKDDSLVKQNLQILCFSLALLQLSVAHIKGIIKYSKAKSLKLLSELGSLAMLAGMYNVVLFLVVSNSYRRFPLLSQSLYFIALGFILSFVFANYEGNIGASILESLKNIISVILGLTNVFSDIMSYIRLWAVGLAGSSISATVNTMAGPLLGNFLIFFGILLLVFGHGINVVLNVLSVLVHGVRLNTLEFSSHLGVSWSGIAYRPFSETVKK